MAAALSPYNRAFNALFKRPKTALYYSAYAQSIPAKVWDLFVGKNHLLTPANVSDHWVGVKPGALVGRFKDLDRITPEFLETLRHIEGEAQKYKSMSPAEIGGVGQTDDKVVEIMRRMQEFIFWKLLSQYEHLDDLLVKIGAALPAAKEEEEEEEERTAATDEDEETPPADEEEDEHASSTDEDHETLGAADEFDDKSLAAMNVKGAGATTVAHSVRTTGVLQPSRNTQGAAPPIRTSSIASAFSLPRKPPRVPLVSPHRALGAADEFDDKSLAATEMNDVPRPSSVAFSVGTPGESRDTQAAPPSKLPHVPMVTPQRSVSNSTLGYTRSQPGGFRGKRPDHSDNTPTPLRTGGSNDTVAYARGFQLGNNATRPAATLQESKDDLETLAEERSQMSSESGTSATSGTKEWEFQQLANDRIREREEFNHKLRVQQETVEHWQIQAAEAASREQTVRNAVGQVQFEAQETIVKLQNDHVKETRELEARLQKALAQNNSLYSDGTGQIAALQGQLDASHIQSRKLHEDLVAARQTSESWRIDAQGMRTNYNTQVALVASRNTEITHLNALRAKDSESAQKRETKLQDLNNQYMNLLMSGKTKDVGWQTQLDKQNALVLQREDELRTMHANLTSIQNALTQAQTDSGVATSRLQAAEKNIQELTAITNTWRDKCNEVETRALGLEMQRSSAVSALDVATKEYELLKNRASHAVTQRDAAIAALQGTGDDAKKQVHSLHEDVDNLSTELAEALKQRDAFQERLAGISAAQAADSTPHKLNNALHALDDSEQQIEALRQSQADADVNRQVLERELEKERHMKQAAVVKATHYKDLAEKKIEQLKVLKKRGPRAHSRSSSSSRSSSPVHSSGRSPQARYLYVGNSKTKPASW